MNNIKESEGNKMDQKEDILAELTIQLTRIANMLERIEKNGLGFKR